MLQQRPLPGHASGEMPPAEPAPLPRPHGIRDAVPALLAAVSFGLTFPTVRAVFGDLPALFGAGWLYFASGIGLTLLRWTPLVPRGEPLARRDLPWLAGAIVSGGIVAPFANVRALSELPGHVGALLANLEVVFTALFAVLLFGERLVGRRAAGIAVLLAGGIAASGAIDRGVGGMAATGAFFAALAALGWGIDNNLTRRIAAKDAVQIARWKGLLGGAASLGLAGALGAIPSAGVGVWFGGGMVGFVGYGLSLVLFVTSLRTLGAALTTAIFGVGATLVGTLASALLLSESVSAWTGVSAVLVLAGVVLATWERAPVRS